jgi:antirestriction protein ArdC
MAFMNPLNPWEPSLGLHGSRLHEVVARQVAAGRAPWQTASDPVVDRRFPVLTSGLDEEPRPDDCLALLTLAAVAREKGLEGVDWLTNERVYDLGLDIREGEQPVTLKFMNPEFTGPRGDNDRLVDAVKVYHQQQTIGGTFAQRRRDAPNLVALDHLVKASGIVPIDNNQIVDGLPKHAVIVHWEQGAWRNDELLRGACSKYVKELAASKAGTSGDFAWAGELSGRESFLREHLQTDLAAWTLAGRLGIEYRDSFPNSQFRQDMAAFLSQRPDEIYRAASDAQTAVTRMDRDVQQWPERNHDVVQTTRQAWELTPEEIDSIGRDVEPDAAPATSGRSQATRRRARAVLERG